MTSAFESQRAEVEVRRANRGADVPDTARADARAHRRIPRRAKEIRPALPTTRAIDRRTTQVSIRGGREQGRQGRERSTRWYRGGREAWCTPKKSPLSMNWAACKRSEGGRSTASRMPKKPMTGSRPEHNWRRRAGCTHGGLSGAINFRFLHAAWSKARRICRSEFARTGRQSVRAAWQQGSSESSKALPAHT